MKSIYYIAGIFLLLLVSSIFIYSNYTNALPTTSYSGNDIQIVKLKVVGGSYVLEPNEIKKNIPVRIEADISQMPGCSKSIVIPSFNIRKTLSSYNNIIEFTPDKAGTFNIACSMNMYKGTFIVLDDNGTKGDYIEPKNTQTHTCGSSAGGCGGCGG